MANWGAIFAGFSPETQAQLLPYAQAYDQCMREWDAKRRFFQKQAYHTSAPPLAISPWSGRSPLDPGLRNLGVAWYVPRRQTMRAYGRELAIARSTGLPAARTAAQQTGVARELTVATLPASHTGARTGCWLPWHAARGRYPPSRVNGGGAENDGKVDTSKTIVQVDAAATVVASLAAVSIFLRNERPGASHAPPCHTHTRRGRAVGFVPGALRAHVGVRCALDAGYLQGPRPFSQAAARRHGGGRPDPIR
jgi:hypothetical protein